MKFSSIASSRYLALLIVCWLEFEISSYFMFLVSLFIMSSVVCRFTEFYSQTDPAISALTSAQSCLESYVALNVGLSPCLFILFTLSQAAMIFKLFLVIPKVDQLNFLTISIICLAFAIVSSIISWIVHTTLILTDAHKCLNIQVTVVNIQYNLI